MAKANQKFLNHSKPNASMAMMMIVISSVLVMIVGGFFTYLGLFLNANLAQTFDSTLNPTAAHATLSWTGDSRCGDTVNITDVNGVFASFYINVSGQPASCPDVPAKAGIFTYINLTNLSNTSAPTVGNLTSAINNNATFALTMTASNLTNENMMVLTYNTIGKDGNNVVVAKNAANAAWSSANLAGGTEGTTAYATTKTNLNTGYTVIGILFIIIGASGCILALMSVVGSVGAGKRK